MEQMNHIFEAYLERLGNDVDRHRFIKHMVEDDCIMDDVEGLKGVLDADFMSYVMYVRDPNELNTKRIAYAAVVSFVESYGALRDQLIAGTHESQRGTGKDGGAQG